MVKIDGRYFFQIYEAFSFFNLKRGNYKSFPPAAFSTRKFMCIIIILRVIPIPGICIGIGPIPAIFDGIGIGQVCYTSTNFYIINPKIVL